MPGMHCNDSDVDRDGCFLGRRDGCVGQQDSREEAGAKNTQEPKGGVMGQATHEQVNLMLHLYEMRREQKLREAREWMSTNFHAKNAEEAMRLCPPGSQENAYLRMVLGYWEMVASIVNRGLIDEDLFFENSGEQWGVWEQVKPLVAAWRTMFANPQFLANLEEQCRRLETWREKRNPGSVETLRKVYAQMNQTVQESKARAASN